MFAVSQDMLTPALFLYERLILGERIVLISRYWPQNINNILFLPVASELNESEQRCFSKKLITNILLCLAFIPLFFYSITLDEFLFGRRQFSTQMFIGLALKRAKLMNLMRFSWRCTFVYNITIFQRRKNRFPMSYHRFQYLKWLMRKINSQFTGTNSYNSMNHFDFHAFSSCMLGITSIFRPRSVCIDDNFGLQRITKSQWINCRNL